MVPGLGPPVIIVLAARNRLVTDVVPRRVEWAIPIGLVMLVVSRLLQALAVVPKFRFLGSL